MPPRGVAPADDSRKGPSTGSVPGGRRTRPPRQAGACSDPASAQGSVRTPGERTPSPRPSLPRWTPDRDPRGVRGRGAHTAFGEPSSAASPYGRVLGPPPPSLPSPPSARSHCASWSWYVEDVPGGGGSAPGRPTAGWAPCDRPSRRHPVGWTRPGLGELTWQTAHEGETADCFCARKPGAPRTGRLVLGPHGEWGAEDCWSPGLPVSRVPVPSPER